VRGWTFQEEMSSFTAFSIEIFSAGRTLSGGAGACQTIFFAVRLRQEAAGDVQKSLRLYLQVHE
jgi:hypothetical protein